MTSSYTARNRLLKQGAGDNTNTWGDLQSAQDFDMIDEALDGWATIPLSGAFALSTANGTTDQARKRMLKFSGAGAFTVTIPPLSKAYAMWNACTGVLTVSNGSASAAIQPGEVVWIINDGGSGVARVQPSDFGGGRITSVGAPTSNTDAATKAYVDAAAFATVSGNLPGQSGNAGKFLTTDGATLGWATPTPSAAGLATVVGEAVTVTGAVAADVRAGSDVTRAVTAGALMSSSAFQTLTDAATIAWDCAGGYNASVTLTASGHTVGAPIGLYDGLCVTLELVQDATGARTVAWNAIWDFGGAGAPVLQTGAAKADKVHAQYNARTGKLEASFRKGA